MLKLNPLLFSALVILASSAVTAQTIDLGRGELPLTIPENYNSATSTPLIILLHGYSSNGAGQDAYMGFSKIADRYGFILVAPDGTKESAGDNNRFWNASDACCDFFSSEVDDSATLFSEF